MRTYKQGTKAPDSYVATLLTGVSGLDMTTISAAVGKIQAPNGVESSWTMTLSGATTSQVTVTYAFPGTSPFLIPGIYLIHFLLTVPGGELPTEEAEILVKASHEL
jgi:hypothetical protein